MTIREAIDRDIPEIVKVLKASLGEKDLPLSETIWKFKHLENPFGKSLVLLAVEKEKVVGVRAFMRWEWHYDNKTFLCFRAVDTATHPDHQGKGIFKKLTLRAVDLAKEEGADFIFNTPNEKSRPGYLKMGWKSAGKIEVGIQPSVTSCWMWNKRTPSYQIHYETSPEVIEEICSRWNSKVKERTGLCTLKSHGYLEWRYEKNPLQRYEVLATAKFYLSGYVKTRRGIKELRITECIFEDPKNFKEAKRSIRQWASKFGVQFISFSPKLLRMFGIKGNIGPILTVRRLNTSPNEMEMLLRTKNWIYSLGDMELF